MSEVKTYSGILKKVHLNDKPLNEWKQNILDKYGEEYLYTNYFISDKYGVYEYIELDEFYDGEYPELWYKIPNTDEIRFLTQFYTGDSYLDDEIEEAFRSGKILTKENKISVTYCSTSVPIHMKNKYSKYVEIYLSGTKMFLGYKATLKNNAEEKYYICLNNEDTPEVYTNEEEMLTDLTRIFNNKNFSWRYY